MASDVRSNVLFTTGVKAVDKRLENLDKKVQRKTVRTALRTAMKEVLAEARIAAPHETGDLEASLRIRALPRSRVVTGIALIAEENRLSADSPYSAVAEFGEADDSRQPDPFLNAPLYATQGRTRRIFIQHMIRAIRQA